MYIHFAFCFFATCQQSETFYDCEKAPVSNGSFANCVLLQCSKKHKADEAFEQFQGVYLSISWQPRSFCPTKKYAGALAIPLSSDRWVA